MVKDGEMKRLAAANIRYFRERSGKTMTALCASVGMSRAFWTDLEKGNKEPSISTLERIATALEVTIHDLLSERKLNGNSGTRKRKEPAETPA
jgi:transcriptional regulator with XRE-family HTH domain